MGGKLARSYTDNPLRFFTFGLLGFLALLTTAMLLLQTPNPLSRQPFPDAHEYLNAADRLAHGQGYTTTVRDNLYSPHGQKAVNPPRFPPGTSLVLAPFAVIGTYPGNVELGARLIVVGLVVATAWAAFTLAGWYAALLAALFVSTSEFLVRNSQVVMSDALAVLLIVLCLPLIRRPFRRSAYLLGLIAGYGFVVRESGLIVVVCVLLAARGWDRLRVAVAAAVPIVGLALYNWTTFGAPWRTGYTYWLDGFRIYSLNYVLRHPWPESDIYYAYSLRLFHLLGHNHAGYSALEPNLWFYPLIVLDFSAVFGPPWIPFVGLIAAAWRWRLPEAQFTLLLAALTALFYMPNFGQDARYMAGPCILLTAWASAALVIVARRVRLRHGGQSAEVFAPSPMTATSETAAS